MFSLFFGLYEYLFRKARLQPATGWFGHRHLSRESSASLPSSSYDAILTHTHITLPTRATQAEFRLLLVGLDKAGKTSCLEKLRALQLAPLDSSAAVSAAAAVQLPVAPTVGLNIARFELSGCKLTLWDLGGQVSTHAPAVSPVSPGAGTHNQSCSVSPGWPA